MTPLLNLRMHDGSRHFADMPESCEWEELRRHIAALTGAVETGYMTDHVTEMWLDFSYRGHAFSVNNQHGAYWFFVRDPTCPDEVLAAIVAHVEPLFLK